MNVRNLTYYNFGDFVVAVDNLLAHVDTYKYEYKDRGRKLSTINRHVMLIGKATLCCDISIQTVDMCDYKDKDNVL